MPTPTLPPLQRLGLEPVAEGVDSPLDVRARPGDGTLFVAEQRGVIQRIDGGRPAPEPMLDLREEVNVSSIEQGLLGFAFHPDYPTDPRVFVFHSRANNDNVLASYETSGDPDVLDPATRTELLVVDKEPDKVRHNGGTVLFGPDGLLYLSLGDAARYSVNPQNPSTLPGSVLRIDVDRGERYGIPPGNPFAEGGDGPPGLTGAPEVWWFGFRNPWRMTIDEPTGLAYIADVGQADAEEVNVVPFDEGGLNFGWPAREGLGAFVDFELVTEATDPVLEIRHAGRDRGCSVTGGEVYRGPAIPELDGHYFYADWCHGWIRSFRYADGGVRDQEDWSGDLEAGMVSSFGHDADGELLVLDWDADTVSRVVPVR
jgi:glucose/arabinose dehydrogenase